MEKNDQKQNLEQKDNSEMVDVLGDLNEFNTQSSDGVQDDVNNEGLEGNEENQEPDNTNVEENEPTVEEAKRWLIDNKFEDNEEGRMKLAESYRQLQSQRDKEKPGEEYEKLQKLDSFLKENPNVVAAMKGEVSKMQENLSGPPQKPEDYDSYDEDTQGTSSYEWRQSYNQYLVDQGRTAAKSEVDVLRNEMQQERVASDRMAKLKAMGMSDSEIKEYDDFMTDDSKLTEENLVKIYRFLKTGEAEEPVQPVQQKRTSAAAVSGSNPPQGKTKEKEKDEFFNGLMKFSR